MKKVIAFLLILLTANAVYGVSEITLNDVERPNGAVLFIVDGLGSSYFYPEYTPYAIDGNGLLKTDAPNLTFGSRVVDVKVPTPSTGIAHSVIVTGYSGADEELVGYPDATLYDVTRRYGFINMAIMQKGDFSNMRKEQDIIMYSPNNSINNPSVSIQANNPYDGIYELMYDWKMKFPAYLDNKSGYERYSAYNKWGIDAASAVVWEMAAKHPSQRFLLTVNIGAIDSGGHYLGNDDYVRLISDLDRDFYPLYEMASENNIALFFTADHGMSFAVKGAQRGGHGSGKYSSMQESLRIPFAVFSSNVDAGVLQGEYGQEDIAPTVLGVLDLPDTLQYGDGEAINLKNYASVFVNADTGYNVSLWSNGVRVTGGSDSELVFAGLPLNANYRIEAAGSGGKYDEEFVLDSDKLFSFIDDKPGFGKREMIAAGLIMVVNVAGLIVIRRIKD
ncbi:MAG: sulfatase-like hydrolase/transferase [Candidatus Methanoperedens sp.]|jgi:hypothetical protein|nr:sulfatase-like hydrolase/transferase [Candidatus Methanoperedens sp.]PKL52991.1 MAG: hypothetical protein CVV36_09455 [Candidatus Methanoperedenaceae archaeon HGW-Methanoperedenaceae-1]